MLDRNQWIAIGLVSGFAYILGKDKESFNAPYAGSGSLMGIKQDTSIGDFSAKELTESSAIHGDFNEASLNYSGHQNIQVRGAESFEAEDEGKKILTKYIDSLLEKEIKYLKKEYPDENPEKDGDIKHYRKLIKLINAGEYRKARNLARNADTVVRDRYLDYTLIDMLEDLDKLEKGQLNAESFEAEEYTVEITGFMDDALNPTTKRIRGTEQELKDQLFDFHYPYDRIIDYGLDDIEDEEEAMQRLIEKWNKQSIKTICDDDDMLTLITSEKRDAESFEAEERWYLSDPCYAIPDDRWGEFCDKLFSHPNYDKNKRMDIEWEVDGEDYIVEVWDSPGGDGVWSFSVGEFGVDAGLLAVIPEKVAMERGKPFGGEWFDKKPTLFTDNRNYIVEINGERNQEFDAESFEAEKKNCGCGQDPCVTYGAEPCEGESFEAEKIPMPKLVGWEESEEVGGHYGALGRPIITVQHTFIGPRGGKTVQEVTYEAISKHSRIVKNAESFED